MTYQELQAEIQDLLDASDTKGIIQILTPINVAIVIATEEIQIGERVVPYTNLTSLESDYNALFAALDAATTVNAVLLYFRAEYALTAQFGREYIETEDYTLEALTDAGFSNPEAESQVRTSAYFSYLNSLQI